MELFDSLMTVRSIRRFTPEPVTDNEILTCLRAANQATNGGNKQPWQFLVITDPATKAAIGQQYKRGFYRFEKIAPAPAWNITQEELDTRERNKRSAFYLADHFGESPALVAFLMPRQPAFSDADGPIDAGDTIKLSVYPAIQNFILAARNLGIGTCVTTVSRVYQDEARETLKIPTELEIGAVLPMGRPKGRFGLAPRRPLSTFLHWNSFNGAPPAQAADASVPFGEEEANQEIIRRYAEAWNTGDLAVFDEVISEDATIIRRTGTTPYNSESVKLEVKAFRAAFPDLKNSITRMNVEGDEVIAHHTITGTHQGVFQYGPLGPWAATGNPLNIWEFCFYRVAGGKIVEFSGVFQRAELVEQIAPSKEVARA